MSALVLLRKLLEPRLDEAALDWFSGESRSIADDANGARFGVALSKASRYARDSKPLAPSEAERADCERLFEGLDPERWTLLETLRIALILSRPDLAEEAGQIALEEAFRYADEGEARALYRSLALLPDAKRFTWRAGEGCRTNMRSVFEAVTLDTPFPVQHFDDVAWHQAVIKCLFVGAPLWRLWGLDGRLNPDLARMALDLAEERTSAGREVYPELWLCLGTAGGDRGRTALLRIFGEAAQSPKARGAAAVALVRAGLADDLEQRLAAETDEFVLDHSRRALAGETSQAVFAAFRDDS